MKKLLALIILTAIAISLSGCAKCISTETQTVQVKVIDKHYHGTWVQPVIVGKVHSTIVHPAEYKIVVEYEGVEYIIHGKDTYDKYSNRIGKYASGVLQTKKYDDGSAKHSIVSLEDIN